MTINQAQGDDSFDHQVTESEVEMKGITPIKEDPNVQISLSQQTVADNVCKIVSEKLEEADSGKGN